jgi:hypothetical protein
MLNVIHITAGIAGIVICLGFLTDILVTETREYLDKIRKRKNNQSDGQCD